MKNNIVYKTFGIYLDCSIRYSSAFDYNYKRQRLSEIYEFFHINVYGNKLNKDEINDTKEWIAIRVDKFNKTETGHNLNNYLKSIERTVITYSELVDIINKYNKEYYNETGNYYSHIPSLIEFKIIPIHNILVYDPISLKRKIGYSELKYIEDYKYDSNLELLTYPPSVNLEELLAKNETEYQQKLYEDEIKWKQDHGFLPKNDGTQYYPKKKTAPTLAEGWCVYILLMIIVSIFHSRVLGWIAITIFFLIWRKLEIDKFN